MRTAPAPTEVLTVDEAAERLRVGRRTVYRLIAQGDLRTVNVAAKGTRIRLREDDVAAFIEARTVDSPTVDDDLLGAGN